MYIQNKKLSVSLKEISQIGFFVILVIVFLSLDIHRAAETLSAFLGQ